MGEKHKSIGERLRKAKSLDVRREIGLEWAADCIEEHELALSAVERAIRLGDIRAVAVAVARMREHTEKRLRALPNVIQKLADEDI